MVRFVRLPAAAIKAMVRVGIEEKLMRLTQTGELGVELAHLIGGRILIEFAEMALDRAANIGGQGCRRWPVAPLRVTAAAVEIDGSFKERGRRRAEEGDAPAHAKADDAQARGVRGGAALEEANRRVDVVQNVDVVAAILDARGCLRRLRFAFAVIELRRDADITGRCDPPGHLLGELDDTVLVLHDDDRRHWAGGFGLSEIHAHGAIIDGDFFPGCFHKKFGQPLERILPSFRPPMGDLSNDSRVISGRASRGKFLVAEIDATNKRMTRVVLREFAK